MRRKTPKVYHLKLGFCWYSQWKPFVFVMFFTLPHTQNILRQFFDLEMMCSMTKTNAANAQWPKIYIIGVLNRSTVNIWKSSSLHHIVWAGIFREILLKFRLKCVNFKQTTWYHWTGRLVNLFWLFWDMTIGFQIEWSVCGTGNMIELNKWVVQ